MKFTKLTLLFPPAVLMGCNAVPQSGVEYPDKPPVITSERTGDAAKPRSYNLLQQIMLRTHNDARRAVGVAPLIWNNELEAHAKRYAQKLASSGKFKHDKQKGITPRQGENLWMGTRSAFTYAEMSGSWVDEKRYFKRGIFPDNTTTGKWSDVGHYTQIIWRGTTHVGCAIVSNKRDDYLVCRYSSAGNVVGQDPLKS